MAEILFYSHKAVRLIGGNNAIYQLKYLLDVYYMPGLEKRALGEGLEFCMRPAQFFILFGSDNGFTAVCSLAAAWESVSPGFLNPASADALGDSHWQGGSPVFHFDVPSRKQSVVSPLCLVT